MSVNPASPMKNINVKRVGTRGLGSISRKDNRSDISLAEIDEKKRHHRKVSARKIFSENPQSGSLDKRSKVKPLKAMRHRINQERQGYVSEVIETKFPKKVPKNLNKHSNHGHPISSKSKILRKTSIENFVK